MPDLRVLADNLVATTFLDFGAPNAVEETAVIDDGGKGVAPC
jgi:hypothetical protein